VILRRALVLSLMLLCWHNLPAQEIQPAPKDCPTEDGYQWSRFNDAPAGKVMWVQTRTQRQFEDLCQTHTAAACALRFQNITVIVAQSPQWAYSEALQHHEGCHDAWKHELPRSAMR
jgi:hypothetical protein